MLKYGDNEVKKVAFSNSSLGISDEDVKRVIYNNAVVFEKISKTIVAVATDNIYYSLDDGETWDIGYYNNASISTCDSCFYSDKDKMFISWSSGDYKTQTQYYYTSTNGQTWERVTASGIIKKMDTDEEYGLVFITTSGTVYYSKYYLSGSFFTFTTDKNYGTLFYKYENSKVYIHIYDGYTDTFTFNNFSVPDDYLYDIYDTFNGYTYFLTKYIDSEDDEYGCLYVYNSANNRTYSLKFEINWFPSVVKLIKDTNYLLIKDPYSNVSYQDVSYKYVDVINKPTSYNFSEVPIENAKKCMASYIDGYYYYPQYKDLRRNTSLTSSASGVLGLGSNSRHVYEVKKGQSNIIAPSNYGLYVSPTGGGDWVRKLTVDTFEVCTD